MSECPIKEVRECPVCGSRDVEERRRVTSVEAARNCLNPRREQIRYNALCQHIEALWGSESSFICKCRACGFGFAYPYVAGGGTFYNLAYDRITGEYPADKWEYRIAKEALAEFVNKDERSELRLLEIGAGNGSFLRLIVPALVRSEAILCTEYSDQGAAQIRKMGVRVTQTDVRTIHPGAERFDIVCMFQVLEHMDRLSALFLTLRSITSKWGEVLIAVPNSRRNQFNEDNGAVLDMPPNHIGRWTRSSFHALARREGWQVVDYLEEPTNRLRSWQTFSIYRYARSAQRDDCLAARIRGLRPSVLSQVLEIATIAIFAIRSVRHLPALFSAGMGESVFVRLRKQG